MSSRSAHLKLVELGWPLASFGLGFWSGEPVSYLQGGRVRKLVQPFARSDAFELLGPLPLVEETQRTAPGERLVVASLTQTKGLKSPEIWKRESLLGGHRGVLLTKAGHVHRQFAGDQLPEWFEAVEVTYHPQTTDLEKLLHHFWRSFDSSEELLFYENEQQKGRFLGAWESFARTQPPWAVPHEVRLKPCKWFEPAPGEKQKSALRDRPVLHRTLAKVDLAHSHLATKFNAFAGGFGEDEDVVFLAARHGLGDDLTTALRTVRYFQSSREEQP
jgi:hypothetical protein